MRIVPQHLILCLFLAGSFPVAAQAPATTAAPVYAVLSLIGDRLEIVVRTSQTGSRLDQNRRDRVDISDPVLDNMAVSAAAKGIRLADAKAEISHLNTRSPVLFEKQRVLFDVSGNIMAMPDAIRDALRAQGATRFVLIVRNRDDAAFKLSSGITEGVGTLEGLGFYVDGMAEARSADSQVGGGARAQSGFIAPFAYLTLYVVEFPSGRVMAKKSVTDFHTTGGDMAGQAVSQPWNALSSAEKVKLIGQLIDRVVSGTLQELVAMN